MTVVASNYTRKENDLYQTEPWATRALLKHFPVNVVWEASAGNHLMADIIKESGAKVITSDIHQYDREHDFIFNFFDDGLFNFLGDPFLNKSYSIITNPPYGKGNRDAAKYARLALQRCSGVVALLLTAKFDFGKTRMDLFANNPRFAAKIVLVDRIQWFPGETSGSEDHAWYIWSAVPGKGIGQARIIYEGRKGNE